MSQAYPEPLAKRPNLGKAGKSFIVKTNHFGIKDINTGTIHHYDVSISPEVPSKINQQVMRAFEVKSTSDKKVLNKISIVFDGLKNLFSPRSLPFGAEYSDSVVLAERGGKTASKSPRIFKITLKKVNEIPVDIEEMHQKTSSGLTAMMAFNVLFRHQPDTRFVQIKNSFYICHDVNKLSGAVEVWPGFFRSFNTGSDGMSLNVDTSVCVFYQSGNLLDLFTNFIGLKRVEELKDNRVKKFFTKFKSFIKRLRVNMSYRGEAPKEYKVLSLSPQSAAETKFNLMEGDKNKGQITIAKYFQQHHNIRLDFPNLPCVEIKRGILVPMEFFDVLPGQRYIKKLDEKQTAEMIKITCLRPSLRASKIMEGLKMMAFEKNDYIKQFGLQVNPAMKQVPARLLPTPTVQYHPSSRESAFRPRDGAWNMRDKKVSQGMELRVWAVVVYAQENWLKRNNVEFFVKQMVDVCEATGMKMTLRQPKIVYLNPNSNRFEDDLKKVYTDLGNSVKKKPQMLMCVLPDKGAQLYGNIKATSELGLDIPTQCVQAAKVKSPNPQYCANVCLKINAKLGGINASMPSSELPALSKPPTLIIGADVTHPSPGNIEANSIAAAIGSIDLTGTRFASSIRVQESRVEFITDLSAMVVELLKMFYKGTKQKPARIVYYRDGVSDGQFSQVLMSEMVAIKKACAALEATYRPTITFVVVQKRHHTRFFSTKPADEDRSGNLKAGTIVESGICHPTYFDFYLQSHAGLQGTSRPCHYHVLVDENKFGTDAFQSLTYNLCYLFNRATRAVSIVPPVYYAHLAAARARCHYKISDSFSDTASMTSELSGITVPSETRKVSAELQKTMYYV